MVDTTTAAELTAEQVQKILVQPLEQASRFLSAGPRIFDSANPVRIPKLTGTTAPGFVGESAEIPVDDVDFGEVTLLPSTMQGVKVITKFSNQMARQSVISLDAALRDRLVGDVAAKLDMQFLSASGDGITTPRGLFAYTGTQSLDVAGALSIDTLHDAEGLAPGANVDPTRLVWLMQSREFVELRKLKASGTGEYLVQPDVTEAGAYRLLGHRVIVTNRVPDTTASPATARAALVDFSQLAVARDIAPSVKILDQTYASTDEMALRVTTRYDATAMNPEAVVKITNITIPV